LRVWASCSPPARVTKDALNELIATGSAARIVLLDRWVAIKSAEDLAHVEARFGLAERGMMRLRDATRASLHGPTV
jgi:hypothetical protein